MGVQVIPHGDMALNVSLIALLKYMDMMRPVITAFGVESSSGNAEFTSAFVAQGFEFFIVCIDKGEVFYDRHDIDDRLGGHTFDRRTSDVIDPDAVFAKYLFNLFRFFFEHGRPFGTIVYDFDFSCHDFPLSTDEALQVSFSNLVFLQGEYNTSGDFFILFREGESCYNNHVKRRNYR